MKCHRYASYVRKIDRPNLAVRKLFTNLTIRKVQRSVARRVEIVTIMQYIWSTTTLDNYKVFKTK